MNGDDPTRLARLNKQFQGITSGKISVSPSNAKTYLEAIYKHFKPTDRFSTVMTSEAGRAAFFKAIEYDLSVRFFNEEIASLIRCLQDGDLAVIDNGRLLDDIITGLVGMKLFWTTFGKEFLDGNLDENGTYSFGWLYWKLCHSSSPATQVYRSDSDMTNIIQRLKSSTNGDIQKIGMKIHDVYIARSIDTLHMSVAAAPGGRHDNDFADFRQISVFPTQEEIGCKDAAFLRPSSFLEDPATKSSRVALHLDNQFRLLREDMLSELKEELQLAKGENKCFRRGVTIKGLSLLDINCGSPDRRDKDKLGLVCLCEKDIPQLEKFSGPAERNAFLKDKTNFLKHQSLTCLMAGKDIIAFATIHRDEHRLVKNPPEIVLQFEDKESMQRALYNFKMRNEMTLVQINTAVFAFEPVLNGLQQAKSLPLSTELILWKEGDDQEEVEIQAELVVRALRANPRENLKRILNTPKDIILDSSQARSLVSGLTKKVSLIQGPPGTGKSFIGALIAKSIHDLTERTILVVCYTNHALDDILEGLMDIGIPESNMIRLGGKCTPRTEPLQLNKQPRGSKRLRSEWEHIDGLRAQLQKLYTDLNKAFIQFHSSKIRSEQILAFLEFADEDRDFFGAFQVPASEDGFQILGSDNKAAGPDYLLEQWATGQDAGPAFMPRISQSEDWRSVWSLPPDVRKECMARWKDELLRETIDQTCGLGMEYNRCHQRLIQAIRSDTSLALRSSRIVGCTTTAAAKYREQIQTFNPDVLLVEEAGEILESHVLTSLGPETSQMVLIGDHKQLRPKVNNYALTVEKGDGYNLNCSLFERLILKDYPHESLSQQHRMRPEISALIRQLTYPELVDASKTQNRPDIRGLRDNIIFIDHDYTEDEFKQLAEKRDMASTSSKQNTHEVEMVLKIVRYLGQQGYGTNDLVILTPYLGQLQKLREFLRKDNDPVLNDLDSNELIRAGLLEPSTIKSKKKPIRLATIDNYQGEESDIVVVSLTRSNKGHDIGFMFSPERLNVLLSRARNGLIMIGNAHTFKNARKGKELWQNLFKVLENDKHIYQGLPVGCERHKNATATLSLPGHFDTHCPDGGCTIPCGSMLSCGLHLCPLKCHQQDDHSKAECSQKVSDKCPSGHSLVFNCSKGPPKDCSKCERAQRLAKERQEQDLADQQKRDEEQRAHLKAMDDLNAQIDKEQRARQQEQMRQQRADALAQRKKDLENIKASFITPAMPNFTILSSIAPNIQPPANNPNAGAGMSPLPTSSSNPLSTQDGRASPSSSSFLSRVWSTVSNLSATIEAQRPTSTLSGKPFKKLAPSPAQLDWEHHKNVNGVNNAVIDAIMQMTGLEEVKQQVLKVLVKIETAVRQNASMKRERFNVTFLGNPGTGKTTVARHYAKFLASVKVIPGDKFEERTGALLAHEGVGAAKALVDAVTGAGGGVIFIDEAYQLTSGNNHGGAAVLDYLLTEMENCVGTLVFILAGYNKDMEKFFEHNPGLKSRVPYQFQFADYRNEEFMSIFNRMIHETYSGRMKVEGGVEGLYGRIVIRRLGRRRGHPGFGNVRDLENIFSKIRGRQALRLTKERKEGHHPDDLKMTSKDLIGPDPSDAILESKAREELQSLIGLKTVKETVSSLVSSMTENYHRELQEKEPLELSLNRVFLGSPGTGKTTVAKLYGQILADIGLLSNGEVVSKTPADFVGDVIGASERNTKAILASTVGKVLIIDEAYMLYGGGGKNSGSGSPSNQFKTSVIDTIVAEVQSTPGEDRCVLLLGYRDQMLEMFQNVNPGLSRRFKIEDAFTFEDFTEEELARILDLKLNKQDLDATDPAKKVAVEHLARMKMRPNFGNAGEVENLITQAKTRVLDRRNKLPASERPSDIVFTPEDFDPNFNREAKAAANLAKLFEDIIGHESILQRLSNYQQMASICRLRDLDPRDQIPMNFIFTGPPGTGKTTIARKVGQVFYDMGLLSSAEVVECSVSDLVGQYVGHTGPKTRKVFEKALGKVLFIDEAYRLAEGHFAQEATDELVGSITQTTFKGKLVVVLAGYEQDMRKLMSVNTGISSRFPEHVVFRNMTAEQCMGVVEKELKKKGVEISGWHEQSSEYVIEIKELLRDLAELPDWGNARDMVTLSKDVIGRALLQGGNTQESLKISAKDALDVVKNMVEERQRRSRIPKRHRPISALPTQTQIPEPPQPPPTSIGTTASPAAPTAAPPTSPGRLANQRDALPNRGRGRGPRELNRGRGQGVNTNRNNRTGQPQSPQPQTQSNSRRDPCVSDGCDPAADQHDPGVSDAVCNQPKTALPNRGRGRGAPRELNRGRGQGVDTNRNNRNNQPQQAVPSPLLQTQNNEPGSRLDHCVSGDYDTDQRDPGVSDTLWNQLKTAKRVAEANERRRINDISAAQTKAAEQRKQEEGEKRRLRELEREVAEAEADRRAELGRERAEARRRAEAIRQARLRAEKELRDKREAERRRKEEEEEVQRRLRHMGACPMGYRWINMGTHYRCAGGTHFVSMNALGL